MLTQKLQNLSLQQRNRAARVAVIGVGDERSGDHAAGLNVTRQLRERCRPDAALPIVELSTSPEAICEALRSFKPDLILLIDAVDINRLPVAIRYSDWQDTIGLSGSQPVLSPHEIAGCLVDELSCEVALIGIEPDESALGAPLSPDVRQAVDEVVQGLQQALAILRTVSV